MSASWLDHLPSGDREKIRRKMRSPEAYEKLRDRVKGPEDLTRELQRSERLAEVQFALKTEPQVREQLKSRIESDSRAEDISRVFDGPLSQEQLQAIQEGRFSVTVSAHPTTHQDQLVIIPEGTVQEAIPLTIRMSDVYVSQLLGSQPNT